MKIDKTPFSWMLQFRLFGRDFMFGYINMKEVSETVEISSVEDVNLMMNKDK